MTCFGHGANDVIDTIDRVRDAGVFGLNHRRNQRCRLHARHAFPKRPHHGERPIKFLAHPDSLMASGRSSRPSKAEHAVVIPTVLITTPIRRRVSGIGGQSGFPVPERRVANQRHRLFTRWRTAH